MHFHGLVMTAIVAELSAVKRNRADAPGGAASALSYILPSGLLYATYRLLWEPKTTIDFGHPNLQVLAICKPPLTAR